MTRRSMCITLALTVAVVTIAANATRPASVAAAVNHSRAAAPVVTIAAVTTPAPAQPAFVPLAIELPADLQEYTYNRCAKLGVPFAVALALMWQESRFQPDAVSADGEDYGLLQLRAEYHGKQTDPRGNIDTGLELLAGYLIEQHGDIGKALMLYNCGPTGARRLWAKGIYSTEYSRAVQEKAEEWEE